MGTVNDYLQSRLEFAEVSQANHTYCEPYDKDSFQLHGSYVNPESVVMGVDVRVLPGSHIGFKGFSWGFDEDQTPVEIRHKGGVVISDYVEIGAGCNIARATLKGTNTIIGEFVKIDSLVHIAHNCVIGNRSILTAGVILGGNVTVGERSWLGINCTIMNGIKIGKNNLIAAGANIRTDTKDNAIMYGDNMFLRFRND